MSRLGRSRDAGFTLLEVIISLAIAGLSLVALMQASSTGLRLTGRAYGNAEAILLARSKLDEVGTVLPLVPGRLEGQEEDGSAWEIVITLVEEAAPISPARRALIQLKSQPDKAAGIRLLSVEVVVRSPTGHTADLRTLRLGIGPKEGQPQGPEP